MKHFRIMACCVLVAAWASPVWAESKTEQQVEALQAQVNTLMGQVNSQQAQVNTLQTQLAQIKANPVLALGPYVAVDPNPENGLAGPHVIFYGANVHIVSGSGQTVDTTGLGNLVVGYDEDSHNTEIIDGNRTGSHNLVIGTQHMFTASAGIVAGQANFISSNFATVTGGQCNAAGETGLPGGCIFSNGTSDAASVSGGLRNTASGKFSTVSAGNANTASGLASSVSGGGGNTASEQASSVSGGNGNAASGFKSSVSGGQGNAASGTVSSVGGGVGQQATSFGQTIN
jgi:hypothetical protein